MGLIEFFSLKDACPLVALVCLLQFAGGRIAGEDSVTRRWARGFAAAGFLLYLGLAAEVEEGPATPREVLRIVAQGLLAMGTAHGVALATLPAVRFLHLHLWAKPIERRRAAAEERERQAEIEARRRAEAEAARAERERAAEERRRRAEEIASRLPPPTREQRMAAAKARHEAALATLAEAGLDDRELHAAREVLKQQYLREIDQAMR